MAQVIWTEPALSDLDAIADYIALDKPDAARRLVCRVFETAKHLARFPKIGRRLAEIPNSIYREISVAPCRIFYRYDERKVYIIFIMRAEREFKEIYLEQRE